MISQTSKICSRKMCVSQWTISTPQKGAEGSPMVHDFILGTSGIIWAYLGFLVGSEFLSFHASATAPPSAHIRAKVKKDSYTNFWSSEKNNKFYECWVKMYVNVENVGKRIRGQWKCSHPKQLTAAAPQWTNSWGSPRTFVLFCLARFATDRLDVDVLVKKPKHMPHMPHQSHESQCATCDTCITCVTYHQDPPGLLPHFHCLANSHHQRVC